MSTLTMGMAEEFRPDGVAFTALWPRTLIATAAVQNLLGGDVAKKGSRRPEIMADAAHAIFTRPARGTTGTFFIDEDVLHETGVGDFGPHGFGPESSEADLIPDLYV
jgi:citronellol/citronellal dehydrogenase